ncbi:uncharacterized protein LOC115730267 isoform X1 [Rhodamnia argentea]|uniref:Uncharacterized protein LOC115730267 isoform X1 n=1 Tax=Rhodamnia argentea TaxID=178133 RepID=A0A8B8N2W4_9MYRT|nr:uncharacterized protein LOC115730267 isoform X1 [Rhodamnia argentea]
MAETSAALCFTTFFSSFPSTSRTEEVPPPIRRLPSLRHNPPLQPSRVLRFAARASSSSSDPGNFLGDDSFGFFPWADGDAGRLRDSPQLSLITRLFESDFVGSPLDIVNIQWVPEERVTLFTADGLIQIGGSMVPRRVNSDKRQGRSNTSQKFQRFQESDYMNPEQGLCLGALFDIAATNGLDMGRRLCILGFCRSIEMLSDVVEDAVLEDGGEVVAAEKAIKGGLHEKLTMTVAVPLLWGVPPASERLHLAVRSGGGIVEKVFWQWDFC